MNAEKLDEAIANAEEMRDHFTRGVVKAEQLLMALRVAKLFPEIVDINSPFRVDKDTAGAYIKQGSACTPLTRKQHDYITKGRPLK